MFGDGSPETGGMLVSQFITEDLPQVRFLQQLTFFGFLL